MVKVLLIILVASQLSAVCERNCYMGGDAFAAPLDENKCCNYEVKGDCAVWVLSLGDAYICQKCRLGYRWFDNDCVKIDEKDKCMNPEIKSYPFHPCKVCLISEKNLLVPFLDEETKKYTCVPTQDAKALAVLNNCLASSMRGHKLVCYECQPNYFLEAKSESCVKIDAGLEGCAVSFDGKRCALCSSGYQFNPNKFNCALRSVQISYEAQEGVEQQNPQMMASMRGSMPGSTQGSMVGSIPGSMQGSMVGSMQGSMVGPMPGQIQSPQGMFGAQMGFPNGMGQQGGFRRLRQSDQFVF